MMHDDIKSNGVNFHHDSIFIPHDKVTVWIKGQQQRYSSDDGSVGRCSGYIGSGYFKIDYFIKGLALIAYYNEHVTDDVKKGITMILQGEKE